MTISSPTLKNVAISFKRNLSQRKIVKKVELNDSLIIYFRSYSNATKENAKPRLNDENTAKVPKILYSEVLSKLERWKNFEKKTTPSSRYSTPICLQYIKKDFTSNEDVSAKDNQEENVPQIIHFPYEIRKHVLSKSNINENASKKFPESIVNFTPSDNEKLTFSSWDLDNVKIKQEDLEKPQRWFPTVKKEIENDNIGDEIKYGTCDPHEPVSSVPCGGCGSLLHCTDPSIPGFLPKEVFQGLSYKKLQEEICQRCHFLKEFDVALGVNVSSEEYPKIISHIKNKKALTILMVDLLDFPCSIWPSILEIIGPSKPLIVVGNKVDLFIQEGSWFLNHLKECLLRSLENSGINKENILHVALISAKTKYGVEELINKLHKIWGSNGDVYLVGCTNVGKSTLFNTLIQSDYCKVKAIDLMQRATVSEWPGTTLNLLKFPIMKASGWRLLVRTKRLIQEKKTREAFENLQKLSCNPRLEQIPLQGYVGRSFLSDVQKNQTSDMFATDGSLNDSKPKGINPKDPAFVDGAWCYDTPGVIQEDQIINLLTTSELNLTLPKKMLIPRNFHLKPGNSVFIGGLARLDYLDGIGHVWFTVYASQALPLTITKVEDADAIYQKLLGTNLFVVPSGEISRLEKWPKLSSQKFEISGKFSNEAVADIVLSSAGWISVFPPPAHRCVVEAWTPSGKGIHLRRPPVIKIGHLFRGNRIPGSPAFRTSVKQISVDFQKSARN